MRKTVLVTGAAGTVGTVLGSGLREYGLDYQIIPTDKRAPDRSILGLDVANDYDGLRKAMRGVDAVIHLALDQDEFKGAIGNSSNYLMNKNIYRAALETEPRPRVIVASSVHAAGGHINWDMEPYKSISRKDFPLLWMPKLVTVEMGPLPTSLTSSLAEYGAMKIHLETLGRHYASRGLQVVALRLGGVNADNEPDMNEGKWSYHASWLSHRDCVEIFRNCAENDSLPRFLLMFAVSNNKYRVFDNSGIYRNLGYMSEDDSSKFL